MNITITRQELEVILYDIEQKHHLHGNECLCGFKSARSRSRTEHITSLVRAAMADHLN